MADVLLNQRVIAGLGNVFKSEVLFECRVYPFDHVRDLEPDTIAALVAASARASARMSPSPPAGPADEGQPPTGSTATKRCGYIDAPANRAIDAAQRFRCARPE